ncbi:hypothetical protein ACI65C_009007 [Semiaphis heraclei]
MYKLNYRDKPLFGYVDFEFTHFGRDNIILISGAIAGRNQPGFITKLEGRALILNENRTVNRHEWIRMEQTETFISNTSPNIRIRSYYQPKLNSDVHQTATRRKRNHHSNFNKNGRALSLTEEAHDLTCDKNHVQTEPHNQITDVMLTYCLFRQLKDRYDLTFDNIYT